MEKHQADSPAKWLWVKTNDFGVCALPVFVYFSGDRDVHWGYDLDFDPWPSGKNISFAPKKKEPSQRSGVSCVDNAHRGLPAPWRSAGPPSRSRPRACPWRRGSPQAPSCVTCP